ncbi:hypothetical protein E2C01_077286 [Portunus trituberculatus]|uniref:Uncharacterized protein n=1 Tax=Portunus trituberculatus TaxID=210409 RepID=A0A5B7IB18_PORTR|nr:hypothetical protein [Portunus trituberculatus]
MMVGLTLFSSHRSEVTLTCLLLSLRGRGSRGTFTDVSNVVLESRVVTDHLLEVDDLTRLRKSGTAK